MHSMAIIPRILNMLKQKVFFNAELTQVCQDTTKSLLDNRASPELHAHMHIFNAHAYLCAGVRAREGSQGAFQVTLSLPLQGEALPLPLPLQV
jgi:hypothetical protein